MTHIPQEVFDKKILDLEYHGRLIANVDAVLHTAGILPHMLWSRLSDYCTEPEVSWVRNIKKQTSTCGLLLTGKSKTPVEDRMMAIAGACLRNYVDARMMPVQDVLSLCKSDSMPSPTVLLIPNFCLDKGEGGDIPQWQVSSLLGLLLGRMARGHRTVLYVSSLAALEAHYGGTFRSHVEAHYQTVKDLV